MPFITRAYNRFEVNQAEQKIRKLSSTKRLNNEIGFYKTLPAAYASHFPRMFAAGYNKVTGEYWMDLELYAYENLGESMMWLHSGEVDQALKWEGIAKHLHGVLESFKKHSNRPIPLADLKAMYEDKTLSEYINLVEGFPEFETLSKHGMVRIDMVDYKNFEVIWPDIVKLCQEKLYGSAIPSFVHGDMCFSNILYSPGPEDSVVLKFIDPRGSFGSLTGQGDLYYDLAKLMHSTDVGYEFIIGDKFGVEVEGNLMRSFKLTSIWKYFHPRKELVHRVFDEHLYSHFDKQKIKLIQGLIYIGMCARHYDSKQRQLYMYLSGVKILNEVLDDACGS